MIGLEALPATYLLRPHRLAQSQPLPVLVVGADDIFWVAQLHAALDQRGVYAGEEDVETWIFGNGTLIALMTFQVRDFVGRLDVKCSSLRRDTSIRCKRAFPGPHVWPGRWPGLARFLHNLLLHVALAVGLHDDLLTRLQPVPMPT